MVRFAKALNAPYKKCPGHTKPVTARISLAVSYFFSAPFVFGGDFAPCFDRLRVKAS